MVRGVAVSQSTGQPVTNEEVALGVVTYNEDGKTYRWAIEWDEQGHLRHSGHPDATGAFTIDASPGTYVLLGSPTQLGTTAQASGVDLIFKVVAGQTIDLGKIELLTEP